MGRPRKNSVTPPIIYPLDRALHRRWFVQFYIWHEQEQAYVERRVSGFINRFKTEGERLAAAQLLKKKIEDKLKTGWTVGKKRAADNKKLFHKFTVEQALGYVIEKKESETRDRSAQIYITIKKFFPTWLEENGFAGLLIKNLNSEIIQGYLDHLKSEGRSNKTINNYKTAFVAICKALQKREKIWAGNIPAEDLTVLPTTSEKHAAYSPIQLKKIKEACIELELGYLWLFAEFMLYSLARPYELRHLKVEHLDPDQDRIYIPSFAKGRTGDYIDMYAPLKEALSEAGIFDAPGHYYIFTRDQKPGAEQIGKNYFYKRNREVLKHTGLDQHSRNFDLYSYKHTGCIALYNAGVQLIDIMRQCRHKTPEQTMKYLRELDLFRKKDHLQSVSRV